MREELLRAEEVGDEAEVTADVSLRPRTLEEFVGQAEPVLGAAKAATAWDLSMAIAGCTNLDEFFAHAT